jgi:hypothetical protein
VAVGYQGICHSCAPTAPLPADVRVVTGNMWDASQQELYRRSIFSDGPDIGRHSPPQKRMHSEQRHEPMNTQILPRPVYSNEQQRASLRCPQCGRTKVVEVAQYQDAPLPPKVKCPCGHKFRVPIASSLSTRYRCPQCEGKGYRLIERGKHVTVSALGYHYHTLQSQEPCKVCGGLGMHYPKAASVRGASLLQTALASLVAPTLTGIAWMAEKLGAPGPTIRRWLETDISNLCKRQTLARIKR